MNATKFVITALLSGAVALPALASTHSFGVQEAFDFRSSTASANQKSRAEVAAELQRWQANPVSADGWAWVGGEIGWVQPNHQLGIRNGKIVHLDTLSHSERAPQLPSAEERIRIQSEYVGG